MRSSFISQHNCVDDGVTAPSLLRSFLGLISFEEFRQTWKLLSSHLKTEISDRAIADLARSIDFNKDGSIDINEFMEAFRLVDVSAHSGGPGRGDADLLHGGQQGQFGPDSFP